MGYDKSPDDEDPSSIVPRTVFVVALVIAVVFATMGWILI